MPRHVSVLALLLVALALPGAASAEIYRWVDDQGRDHFTTDLSQVPRAKRTAAKAAAESRPTVNRSEQGAAAAPARRHRIAPATRAPYQRSAPAASGETVGGMGQEQWRERAGALATDVEHLEKRLEVLEEQGADHMPTSSSRNNVPHRRYSKYRARYREWESVGRKLDAARGKLERFEERARRAGVPPGWLRQ
jgi:hypothetical protein